MKRLISMILAIAMSFGMLPVGEIVAFAEEDEDTRIADVTSVKITKTYTKPNELDVIYAEVKGENLDKLGKNPVIVRDQAGKPKVLNSIVENNERLYYELKNPDGIASLIVNNEDYDISGGDIPQVNGIEPSSGLINSTETLTIKGNKFKEFKPDDKSENEINFYNKTGSKDDYEIKIEDDETIKKEFLDTTPGGPYRLEFRKTKDKLTIENNYINLFTILGKLNISDDIKMTPNQGAPGNHVNLEAKNLKEDMSIFFKKNSDDVYEIKNMAEIVSYRKGNNKKDDKYIFKVPKLEQGSYEVFITNKINKNGVPSRDINSEKTFKNNSFIIISDANKPSITEILPKKGPATGIDATIRGRFLGSISPNIFSLDKKDMKPVLEPEEGDKGLSNSLTVTYGQETSSDVIGEYKAIKKGKDNKSVEVTFLKKTVTGLVGNELGFREGSKLNSEGTDSIEVRVPQVTDEKIDPVKDVTLEMETRIKYQYIDDNGVLQKDEVILSEIVTKKDGFTFEQLSYEPEITSITPDKIPVEKSGAKYRTTLEDMKISIHGKNFSVYRYTEKDGKGNDVVKLKYPEVNFGDQIILNKNGDKDKDIDIKVFDKNGREVDGTDNNNLGVKILVTIPKGRPTDGISEGFIGSDTDTRVRNPNRNENPIEMGYTSNAGTIQFVDVEAAKTPTITSVSPDTVTTDGQKGVVIKGQNFYPGVKVYIDGEEQKSAKRNDTGTEIVFDAPKMGEGFRQIIVQNEEGGADTYYPFTYTKTYTDPKITDFNPKKGTAKTLVTVTGKSFVLPNPLVEELQGIGINKLIGTKIMLGDKDVNDYNIEDKKIVLKDYVSNESNKIIQEDNNRNLTLSNYYHSVILQDESTEKYYTIYFDTNSGDIKLTDGDKETYVLGKLDGKVSSVNFKVNLDSIKIDNKTLKFKTPYKIEKVERNDKIVNEITGNKIKIINENELIFEVPAMPREGYYDLKVINPDTKSDVKKDKQGFYYSFQPEYNPKIDTINPNEGSTSGEYFIDIDGEGFVDSGGDSKTSVTIGNKKVDPKDVAVSPDGNTLKVKVPKYSGNLEEETEMDRKTVAVVVVNPDGGSASVENGFTYIIPISHPKITKLILSEGSAAGGESVIIEGSELRFYEPYKDDNRNAQWDEGESFTDINGNGKWDDLRHWLSPEKKKAYDELLKVEAGYEKLIKPILPKIYFGSKEAKVIDFSSTSIEVETPKGQNGAVDVYLVNNDYGTSNKLKYNYKASTPNIQTIVPNVGRKQGNDKIEILGNSFYNSDLLVIKGEKTTEQQRMPLVQFGNIEDTKISNKSVSIDALKNSGKIRDKKSTVEVGNIIVNYDISGSKRDLGFTLTEGTGNDKKEYTFIYKDYKDNEMFLPTKLLKDKSGKSYDKEGTISEYIRVRLDIIEGANSTTRVRVDRGFSPNSKLLSSGQISLRTPAYYTIGKTKVVIINPDGGTADGEFEYKNPDSSPTITNILRDGKEGKKETYKENGIEKTRKIVRVNINGGNTIDILGTDFRKPVKIKIGDLKPIETGIEYDPSNEAISQKMTFKMPQVDEKYVNEIHRVVIENSDGGTAGSDDSNPSVYIQFIKGETTDLEITEVTPKAGPTEGGTRVTILGNDFREKMDEFEGEELKIYIGNGKNQISVPKENIESISINKIVFKTPPYAAGKVSIKVENPDGSITEKNDAYTYVSNPKITTIVDPLNGDIKKESLSIEGGETIKVVGSDFMQGARVVFNPLLKKVSDKPDAQGELIFINGVEYILESGTPGTDVEFIDSNNIKVKTPSGTLDTGGVIVINPDTAGTPKYDISYVIPEISHPQDVRANLIKDEYIRINWNEVIDKATEADGKTVQYEVYMVDGTGRHFLGSTGTTGFVFRDLKPKTTYKFLIRAVGKYGSSKPINESMSNEVRTGSTAGPEDQDGQPGENTTVDKSGDTAKVVIGDDAFSVGNEYVIDLTRGVLSGSKDVVLSMSAKIVVTGKSRTIKIVGSDYNLSFSPNVFENSTLKSNADKSSAGVKFEVSPTDGRFELTNNKGDTVLSSSYLLEAKAFIGASSENLENLNGKMNLVLDYDQNLADKRRFKTINLVQYDKYDRRFKEVYGNRSSYGTSIGDINELGTYTITGSRR